MIPYSQNWIFNIVPIAEELVAKLKSLQLVDLMVIVARNIISGPTDFETGDRYGFVTMDLEQFQKLTGDLFTAMSTLNDSV